MPKLFDVFMAAQVTRMCTHYINARSHTLIKHATLASDKLDKVVEELAFCRELATSERALGSLEAWQMHLNEFESICKKTVTDFNDKNKTSFPEGELVTQYIDEAKTLLGQTQGLFVLFGLDNADEKSDSPELKGRYLLMELSMSRFYLPGEMTPAMWAKMTEFQQEMKDFRTVALKNNKDTAAFMDYASLKHAVIVTLKNQELFLKEGTHTFAQGLTSAVVYSGEYLKATTHNAVSGVVGYLFGSSLSKAAAVASGSSADDLDSDDDDSTAGYSTGSSKKRN